MMFSRFLIPLARTVIPIAAKPQSCLLSIPLRNYNVFASKRYFSTNAEEDKKATKIEATEKEEQKLEEKQEEEKKEEDSKDVEIKVQVLQSQIETKRRVKEGKQKSQRLENRTPVQYGRKCQYYQKISSVIFLIQSIVR